MNKLMVWIISVIIYYIMFEDIRLLDLMYITGWTIIF